jgi:hypothetical protein
MHAATGCWPKVSLCKLEDLGIDWSLFFQKDSIDLFCTLVVVCVRWEKAVSLLAGTWPKYLGRQAASSVDVWDLLSLNRRPPLPDFPAFSCCHVIPITPSFVPPPCSRAGIAPRFLHVSLQLEPTCAGCPFVGWFSQMGRCPLVVSQIHVVSRWRFVRPAKE